VTWGAWRSSSFDVPAPQAVRLERLRDGIAAARARLALPGNLPFGRFLDLARLGEAETLLQEFQKPPSPVEDDPLARQYPEQARFRLKK